MPVKLSKPLVSLIHKSRRDFGKIHILLFPACCTYSYRYCKAYVNLYMRFMNSSADFSKGTYAVAYYTTPASDIPQLQPQAQWRYDYLFPKKGKFMAFGSCGKKYMPCFLIISLYCDSNSAPAKFNCAFSACRREVGWAFVHLATRWWALHTRQTWCQHSYSFQLWVLSEPCVNSSRMQVSLSIWVD